MTHTATSSLGSHPIKHLINSHTYHYLFPSSTPSPSSSSRKTSSSPQLTLTSPTLRHHRALRPRRLTSEWRCTQFVRSPPHTTLAASALILKHVSLRANFPQHLTTCTFAANKHSQFSSKRLHLTQPHITSYRVLSEYIAPLIINIVYSTPARPTWMIWTMSTARRPREDARPY